jgi:hypothetical protein
MPQRLHRIEAGSAHGGRRAGNDGDDHERDRHAAEREGVGRSDIMELIREQAGEARGAR